MKKNLFVNEKKQETEFVPSRFDSDLSVRKVFIKQKEWVPLTLNDLNRLNIGDIFSGEIEIIAEFSFDGRMYYVVNSDAQWRSVKKKYPNSCIVHVAQLLRLWTHFVDGEYLSGVGPKILMAVECLGASVEKVLTRN